MPGPMTTWKAAGAKPQPATPSLFEWELSREQVRQARAGRHWTLGRHAKAEGITSSAMPSPGYPCHSLAAE